MKLLFSFSLSTALLCGANIDLLKSSMQENYKAHANNQKIIEYEYKEMIDKNYQNYMDLYKESQKYYEEAIGAKWGKEDIKLSSKTTFTQYGNDLNSRESVDFENGKVIIEIISDDFINDAEVFEKKFEHLKTQTVTDTISNDPVNKVAINLLKKQNIIEDELLENKTKIIDKDLFKKTTIAKKDIKHKIVKTKDGKKKISTVTVEMVPNHLQIKAKKFKFMVHNDSKRFDIQDSLVFGIMQTESYFNPLAKSHVPAFGLMQIVPSTAGKDSYYALYKKEKILSPYYLYDAKNNIEIGTKYIQIIQTSYLRGVNDPKKLFYCTATAYNAGIGSLCKSITGRKITKNNFSKVRKEAIVKINEMKIDELYKHLTTSDRLRLEAKSYVRKVEKNSKNFLAWDR